MKLYRKTLQILQKKRQTQSKNSPFLARNSSHFGRKTNKKVCFLLRLHYLRLILHQAKNSDSNRCHSFLFFANFSIVYSEFKLCKKESISSRQRFLGLLWARDPCFAEWINGSHFNNLKAHLCSCWLQSLPAYFHCRRRHWSAHSFRPTSWSFSSVSLAVRFRYSGHGSMTGSGSSTSAIPISLSLLLLWCCCDWCYCFTVNVTDVTVVTFFDVVPFLLLMML